jgi:hypothetical protein
MIEDFAQRDPSPAIMANTRRAKPPRDHFGEIERRIGSDDLKMSVILV